MALLSTSSYKGTRDYYPEDKQLQNYIFRTWKRAVESYGYEEYATPLIEPVEIYAAKSGQELVNEQTYQFTDRGERYVTIRPEMTPSVARLVASRRQEFGYPLRLFSIANFMRYERPQKGREREFWQLNVDLFGVESVNAESEIITLADHIMKSFGAKASDYTIRINSRPLIDYMMMSYLGLDIVQSQLMVKLFDRKNKIDEDDFYNQVVEISGNDRAADVVQRVQGLLRAHTMEDLPDELKQADAVRDVVALFSALKSRGVTTAKFDISLMRGLDYYTGIVFEVFDNNPDNRRSMFGGGRYDGLIGLFGVDPVPTVGMAPGATTLEEFLRGHNLMPELRPATDVYVIRVGTSVEQVQPIVDRLRAEGVNVAVDLNDRKIDKQLKTAVKHKIPFMMFIGEQEIQNDFYRLKDTAESSEREVSLERVVTTVADYRRRGEDIADL